jgi:hypothetical protein
MDNEPSLYSVNIAELRRLRSIAEGFVQFESDFLSYMRDSGMNYIFRMCSSASEVTQMSDEDIRIIHIILHSFGAQRLEPIVVTLEDYYSKLLSYQGEFNNPHNDTKVTHEIEGFYIHPVYINEYIVGLQNMIVLLRGYSEG